MCGLAGVAGTIERKHVDAFNNLLEFTVVRGRDSTGVASVDRDINKPRKDTYLFRQVGPPSVVREFKGYDKVVMQGKVMIMGHCRAATVGRVTAANAHPFEFDNVIGAHNGTIPWSSRSDIPGHMNFDTDSEAIIHNISRAGVESVIPLIDGAWALTWYDKADHSINFLRNSERTLCYAIVNDGKTLVWASESQLLHAACERNGVESEGNAWWVPEDTWMKFKIPREHNGVFERAEEVTVKGAPEVKRNVAPFHGGYQPGGHQTPMAQLEKGVVDAKNDDDLLPFVTGEAGEFPVARVKTVEIWKQKKKVGTEHRLVGFDNKSLGEEQFKRATGSTCSVCDTVHDWPSLMKEDVKIAFIAPNRFVCEDCNDPWMLQWYNLNSKKDKKP